MKRYFVILLIVLVVSCKQDVKKNSVKKLLNTEQLIENDSLFSLLKSDLFEISLTPIFDREKESETLLKKKTPHDTFSYSNVFNETTIKFYRDGFSENIISAKIKDSRFIFLDFIHVGVKKESFEKLIKRKLTADSIRITNSKKTGNFVFAFANNVLQEINYNSDTIKIYK